MEFGNNLIYLVYVTIFIVICGVIFIYFKTNNNNDDNIHNNKNSNKHSETIPNQLTNNVICDGEKCIRK